MTLKEEIIEYCYGLNLAAVGFCDASPFYDVEMELLERKKKELPPIPFTETDIAKRVYPELTMPGAKSFVVILADYKVSVYKPDYTKLAGNIAPSSVGADYHKELGSKLDAIESFIQTKAEGCKTMKFVDNSPFVERKVAVRAGLGFIGKNGMLLSNELGSRTFVGMLLTNIGFEPDEPMYNLQTKCKTCNRCIQACPGQAIGMGGEIDCYKCVSYLTQTKGPIQNSELKSMRFQIFGCDICQMVCPYNQPIPPKHVTGASVSLEGLLHMSNSDFNRIIKPTSAGWRGKKVLQRNALIALGNMLLRNPENGEAVRLIETMETDERIEIAEEAKRQLRRRAYKLRHKQRGDDESDVNVELKGASGVNAGRIHQPDQSEVQREESGIGTENTHAH